MTSGITEPMPDSILKSKKARQRSTSRKPAASSGARTAPVANNHAVLPRLDEMLCLPLYAASRLMTQIYQPHLRAIGLTYPQYLVMLALWERGPLASGALGDLLFLDAATVTQLLSRLEAAGLLVRDRSAADARTVINTLTGKGRALQLRALAVVDGMRCELAAHGDLLLGLRESLKDLVAVLSTCRQDQLND